MYYVDITYNKGMDEVAKLIQPHIEWMDEQFESNRFFIASGPKKDRAEGGFFMVKDMPKQQLNEILRSDPIYAVAQVTIYDVAVLGADADHNALLDS